MVNPVTVNSGFIVPLTGADVDIWGEVDVNPNMVALDGMLCGVQTIGITGGPVTLTAPAGFVATPSAGPNQSQNAVLRFTGVLTSNSLVTLPLPGRYVVENLTTGAFQLQLQPLGGGSVVALPTGATVTIINDGSAVKFVDMGKPSDLEFWAGPTVMPAWVSFCTVPPYLPCDGSVHNFSTHPFLALRLLGQFGGNGTTTFATPDLRGRVPLAYDGTGTRVTAAGSGINGQLMGSAGGFQNITLIEAQLPSHYHVAGIYDPTHTHGVNMTNIYTANQPGNLAGGVGAGVQNLSIAGNVTGVRVNSSNGLDTTYSAGSNQAHINMQPSLVTGIWVIKT